MVSIQAPQYQQYALISDFLDLANLSVQEEAALAQNWIKDRPERLKLQNLALATMTGRAVRSFLEHMTADVQDAMNKCESLGSGQQLFLHGKPPAIAKDFLPHMAVLRRLFLPNMHFQCCMLLHGTVGGNFYIFAASSGCSLRKHRSRPIGALVCPVPNSIFFGTAFDPRVWTMVVFWMGDSGRQPQLITPENDGGGETNCPSPPKFTFFDDPDVPFGLSGPPAPPPAPSPAGDGERVGSGNNSRERLPLRPSPPEPQLIRIPMRCR